MAKRGKRYKKEDKPKLFGLPKLSKHGKNKNSDTSPQEAEESSLHEGIQDSSVSLDAAEPDFVVPSIEENPELDAEIIPAHLNESSDFKEDELSAPEVGLPGHYEVTPQKTKVSMRERLNTLRPKERVPKSEKIKPERPPKPEEPPMPRKLTEIISLGLTPGSFIRLCIFMVFPLLITILFPYVIDEATEDETGLVGRIFFQIILIALFTFIRLNITNKYKKIANLALLLIYPYFSCVFVESMNSTYLVTGGTGDDFGTWLGNYLCYMLLYCLIFGITRSISVTTGIAGGITLGFGIANHFVTQFRGAPIQPWDLQSVGTAMDVVENYEFTVTSAMFESLLYLIMMISFAAIFKVNKQYESRRLRFAERTVFIGAFISIYIMLFPVNILPSMGVSVWPWNVSESLKMNGVLGNFVGNMHFAIVSAPEGYSVERVEELASEAEELPALEPVSKIEAKPTIIAIMNESLTDYMAIAENDPKLSEDYLPFIHSLMEEDGVISGTAYSSVFGGNTCDSEYEFLTGNSMHFLPTGSIPYQQYIQSDQTSIVSTLKNYGYTCNAIHPGGPTAWHRDTAYEFLGFDNFTDAYSFRDKRDLERSLTSDKSNYEQLIYEYEKHKKNNTNPLFIFNVTIQNHGAYKVEDYPSTIHIETPENYSQTEQYLTLANKSDTAFKELLEYFGSKSEPVVVLMFGDHWPSIADDNEYFESIMNIDNFTNPVGEDLMKKYQVPYIVWANYDMDSSDTGEKISLNYLKNYLLRASGFEGTLFDRYIENLKDTLPVITSQGIIDKDGTVYTQGDDGPYEDLLNDYYILQYNQTMDDKNKVIRVFEME